MTIIDRIKELAAEQRISLAELERRTGLSSGSITKWGKSSPSIDKLQKVADYFGVTTDFLIGRNVISSNDSNPEAELLAAHLNKDFTDDDMAKIIDYIDMIKRAKK